MKLVIASDIHGAADACARLMDVIDAERPDRVILRGREVTVVDFKFGGEAASYRRQVTRYADLWHELGYQVKGAYLWYVPDGKTDQVC